MQVNNIYDSNNNIVAYQFISTTFDTHNANYFDSLYNTLPLNSGNDNNIELEYLYEYETVTYGVDFYLTLEGYVPYKATIDVYGSVVTTDDPTYADPVYEHVILDAGQFGLYLDYFPTLTQYPVITTILTIASDESIGLYNEGYNDGESIGYNDGYENGYTVGYDAGVSETNPMQGGINLMTTYWQGMTSLMDHQIMPGLTIGGFVSIPLIVTAIIVIFKIVK